MNKCPVCGYPDLRWPPKNFSICPSCGTEFEIDDFGVTREEVEQRRATLRNEWAATGFRWHSRVVPEPRGWSGFAQLMGAGFSSHIQAALPGVHESSCECRHGETDTVACRDLRRTLAATVAALLAGKDAEIAGLQEQNKRWAVWTGELQAKLADARRAALEEAAKRCGACGWSGAPYRVVCPTCFARLRGEGP